MSRGRGRGIMSRGPGRGLCRWDQRGVYDGGTRERDYVEGIREGFISREPGRGLCRGDEGEGLCRGDEIAEYLINMCNNGRKV